jgi:hypothetical protein
LIGPALVLAVIVGLFHVSAYVFIRGRAGARVPLLIVAAVLGAWAGDTVGGRMNIDPLRIGQFHLLSASLVAWLAIGLVAILAVLVPEAQPRTPETVSTSLTRRPGGGGEGPEAGGDDRPTPAGGVEPKPQASR